jgi:ribosomal protein S18 acetylase RimI-like enzyme
MSLPSALGPACVGLRVVVRRRLAGPPGPSGGPAMTDLLGVLEEWGERTISVRAEDGTLVVVDRADLVAGKPVPPRPSVRHRVSVVEAQHRALGSWPPVECEPLGEWRLRAAGGFSARANSGLLVGDPGLPWAEALGRVESFYTARDLPVWVQVVTGSAAERRLRDLGWRRARDTEAEVDLLVAGVAAARRAVRSGTPAPRADAPEVVVAERLDAAWLADDERARSYGEVARAVLEGPDLVGFASVRGPGGPVLAKGRVGMPEGPDAWAGLSDLWVAPAARRRGLGTAVVAALLSWAAERGAATAYLQVRGHNATALGLYTRLGFSRHHSTRYLRPPEEGAGAGVSRR